MKVAATTLAYNDAGIIAGTLRCLEPFVDRHIVLISDRPYYGDPEPPDETEDIANSLGASVVRGDWSLDNFQRNVGIKLCDDCDWILGFDSDEMMTREEMEKFLEFLEETPFDAVAVQPEVYWRTTEYRLRPIPDYTPIIAMRPHVRFTHIRNIDHAYTIYDGVMHHVSWAEPKDIYKKVTCYAHAPEFDGEKWYHEDYIHWEYPNPAKLPTGEFSVVKNPLPKELQEYLDE